MAGRTRRKREKVYATFHYLTRQYENEDGEIESVGFSEDDFEQLTKSLEKMPKLDLEDELVRDQLRFKKIVPIQNIERIDKNTAFGMYKGSYWGHSFDNTDVGKIPADSISLRPFYFLLYRSDSGRIYVGVQYLAQFGNYGALKTTLQDLLGEKKSILAHSFRRDSISAGDLKAKEIIVNVSRRAERLDEKNGYGQNAMISFSGLTGDQETQKQLKNKVLPTLGSKREKIQKAVAKWLNDSELADVNDDEIQGCRILVDQNGDSRTIRFLGGGVYPSQYPLSVSLNQDGHPTANSAKKSMIAVLEDNILAVKEDV